jgi:hypothetical protein
MSQTQELAHGPHMLISMPVRYSLQTLKIENGCCAGAMRVNAAITAKSTERGQANMQWGRPLPRSVLFADPELSTLRQHDQTLSAAVRRSYHYTTHLYITACMCIYYNASSVSKGSRPLHQHRVAVAEIEVIFKKHDAVI